MSETLNDAGRELLFNAARSQNGYLDKPVDPALLNELYDLTKMGPTSANCSPARLIFLTTAEARGRLEPALVPGNVPKVQSAPVTAIIGHDMEFYKEMDRLFAHNLNMKAMFENNEAAAQITALRNGTMQGAYLIMAARAVGLDCGPMSGFDNAKVDEEFFAGTTIKSNFICNLGYGDSSLVMERLPRLTFDEACQVL